MFNRKNMLHIFWSSLILFFSINAKADIIGSVYKDYDANGSQSALELGVGGVVINAFDNSNTAVGNSPQISAFDGSYTLTGLPAGQLRLEYTLPAGGALSYIQPGSAGQSSVVFAADGDTVDVGFNNPADYCQANPEVVAACYLIGDPLSPGSNANTGDVMASIDYNRSLPNNMPNHVAFGAEMGPTWGLAYQRSSESFFAANVLKRHSGYGPLGLGGIYRVDYSGGVPVVSNFVDVSTIGLGIGVDPRTVPGEDPPNGNNPGLDNLTYETVGKVGIGDLDISEDSQNLWIMSLGDKTVYSVNIGLAGNVPTAGDVTGFAVPDPGCVDGDYHPWAVKYHQSQVYVGVVCSNESIMPYPPAPPIPGTANFIDFPNLSATVYELDPVSGVFTNVLNVPLNYLRGCAQSGGGEVGCQWFPWTNLVTETQVTFRGNRPIHPQPILSDIEFSEDGDMLLGFIDRTGLQYGVASPAPNTVPGDTSIGQAVTGGEMLRADFDGVNWTLESNGVVGGLNGAGVGNNHGPGGGEFYSSTTSGHTELGQGGLAVRPGSGHLLTSALDPTAIFQGGILWMNSFSPGAGTEFAGYSFYQNSGGPTLAKGMGIGDLELRCDRAPIEVGNRVWFDTNGNGIQDPNEAVIAGVTVTLHDMDNGGAQVGSAVTDANGLYLFGGVADINMTSGSVLTQRNYEVRIALTDPLLPSTAVTAVNANGVIDNNNLTDLSDNDAVSLGGNAVIAFATGLDGANNHTLDFGFGVVSLGDYVWYDTNQDGIQDGSEVGVNGINVNLYNNATCAGVPAANTTTANGGMPAADGFYTFTGLTTGNYCVEFTGLPAGYQFTTQNVGGDDTIDSDANTATGQVQNINLTADDPTIDAGVFLNGSVAGLTWCESTTNPNTIYNPGDGDTVIPNIGITLYQDSDCSNTVNGAEAGTAVSMDTANPAGTYLFSNLPVGPVGNPICYITEVDVADPDLGLCDTGITPSTLGPDLDTANPNSIDNNFGFEQVLMLGDYVWYDTNQNGIQDGSEFGVNGVTVNLYDNATCAGAPSATTTTANGGMPAADGFYEFAGLPPQFYCVEFTGLPGGYQFTAQNVGGDDSIDSDADTITGQVQNINLTADDPTIDAGVFLNGSIAGLTWCESATNPNTVYNPGDGDTVIPNIGITLYQDSDCSNTVNGAEAGTAVSMDTANPAGTYLFSNLPVGPVGNPICYITEVDVADPDLGICDTGITPSTLGPDLDTNNPNSIDNNFGFDDNLALGDFVWFDVNQNGIQDLGEPGVNGVTVNLYQNATCTGVPDSTTTTANGGMPATDGFYFFVGLDPGSYCVEFTGLPAGYQITGQNVGGDDTIDSDVDPVTGQVQNITLSAVDPTIDAGIFLNGSIAGLTWCESATNANTNYDPGDGDTVIPDIGITLYEDSDCSNTVNGAEAGTAVTMGTNNPAGTYLFTDLPVGPVGNPVCYITEVDVADPDLGICDSGITSSSLGPDLDTSNPDSVDNNFGFDDLISLGDYVWYDNDQDGIQDAGEPGVNGITVNLYHNATCSGVADATTTTAVGGVPAADGYYDFTSLDPGPYCVEFTGLPVDYVFTLPNSGGDDAVDSDADTTTGQVQNINLTAEDPTIDAGIYASNGRVLGLLYCDDSPENGVQDPGEAVAGVDVTLSRDFDCNNTGDAIVGSMVTDATGGFLFDNLPVGLAPAPPNPQVCYTLSYDTNNALLNDCNDPVTPETQVVTIDTTDPEGPPITFIVIQGGPPVPVPVNSWLMLMFLCLSMVFMAWRLNRARN